MQIHNHRQGEHVEQHVGRDVQARVGVPVHDGAAPGAAVLRGKKDAAVPESAQRPAGRHDGHEGPEAVGEHHDGQDGVGGVAGVLVAQDADVEEEDGDLGEEEGEHVPQDRVPSGLLLFLAMVVSVFSFVFFFSVGGAFVHIFARYV